MKRISLFFLIVFIPIMAFAQSADVLMSDFLSQVFNDASTMKGLSGASLWLALLAFAIRVVTSAVKVSVIRTWIKWDNWPMWAKTLWAPLCGVLVVLVAVRPLTPTAMLIGLITGMGAVALHHLLDAVESLPGIDANVQAICVAFGSLLGASPIQQAAALDKVKPKV